LEHPSDVFSYPGFHSPVRCLDCVSDWRPPLTKRVEYTYDVHDRLIRKDVDDDGDGLIDRGQAFVYDGGDVVLSFDGTGSLTHRYLHGDAVDQVFADDSFVEILWALDDNQGTVRDVLNYDPTTDTSSVFNHRQFDAFGKITSETDPNIEFRYAYTGRYFDEDTQLQYNRARWYDATVGRWISEDPIGFAAGDANISRYVGNGPTNFTDPSGLAPDEPYGYTTFGSNAAYAAWFSRMYPDPRFNFPVGAAPTSSASTGSLGTLTGYWNTGFGLITNNVGAQVSNATIAMSNLIIAQVPPPGGGGAPGLPFGIPGYIDVNVGSFGLGGGFQIGAGPVGPFANFPSVHPYAGIQTPGASVTWSPHNISPGWSAGFWWFNPSPITIFGPPIPFPYGYGFSWSGWPNVPFPGDFQFEFGFGTPGPFEGFGAGIWHVR
jgi:RHS repeat-associated protein